MLGDLGKVAKFEGYNIRFYGIAVLILNYTVNTTTITSSIHSCGISVGSGRRFSVRACALILVVPSVGNAVAGSGNGCLCGCAVGNSYTYRLLGDLSGLFHRKGYHAGFYGVAVLILDHAVYLTTILGRIHGHGVGIGGGRGLGITACTLILKVPSVSNAIAGGGNGCLCSCAAGNRCICRLLGDIGNVANIEGHNIGFYGVAVLILDYTVNTTAIAGSVHSCGISIGSSRRFGVRTCTLVLVVPSVGNAIAGGSQGNLSCCTLGNGYRGRLLGDLGVLSIVDGCIS